MKKLYKAWIDLKATGWKCGACSTWNAAHRHECWHCKSPPETRVPEPGDKG